MPKAAALPTISLTAAAKIVGVSTEWVRQLIKGGYLKKTGKGVTERDVWRARVAFLEDDQRRSTKTASASRVQDARAREIEVRTAERDSRLIDIVEHRDIFGEAFGTVRSGLAGVPARCTRDLALRSIMEAAINDALSRAADSFEQATANATAGGAAAAAIEAADA